MTDRLVNDPDGVAVLASRVADATGIPASHVEKDFWVTEVLRGAVQSASEQGVDLVFKGGTSLSKAYRIIDRFSEDVDVLVVLPEVGKGARDKILKRLVGGAEKSTGLAAEPLPGKTTTGAKRGARFGYRQEDPPRGGLSSGVLLELGSTGGVLPNERLEVRSLLAEHVLGEIAGAPEADAVRVRVLDPSRTLVEKLVLLHNAHSADTPHLAVRGARHYYDVHRLLDAPDVLSGAVVTGVAALAREVCTHSRDAALPAEGRPREGFAGSPAFTGGPHTEAARREYESRVLGELIWPSAEHRPSFDDCIDAVQGAAERL